jgi:hypothetical protein
MKADKSLATYRRMRTQPLWRLLASVNGPTVMGLLQTHLYDDERSLPASIFHERIERELERLRNAGEEWPQTAQAYVAGWLAEGYLERRFPAGVSEEVYELSTSTIEAIRFVSGLVKPHSAATESRLGLVKTTDTLHYTLPLTSSKLRSLSQWVLHDPALQALPGGMADGDAAPID